MPHGFGSRRDFEEYRDAVLKNLRQLILALLKGSLTRRVVAQEIGVSESTVTRWLQGKRKPSPENLERIIRAIETRMKVMATQLERARLNLEDFRYFEKGLRGQRRRE